MSRQLDMFPADIYLHCIDPSRNRRRYYSLCVRPTLFGDWILVREWGRIGRTSHVRHEHYATVGAAFEALGKWCRRKQLRGYVTV